jgi:nucleoside-diphosphate-sugar epimerase
MKIAIFGATSQIAKDMILSLNYSADIKLFLFCRNVESLNTWLKIQNLDNHHESKNYEDFNHQFKYDVIINFIGVGNPIQTEKMGTDIFNITDYYDLKIINYLTENRKCRYIFMSSGAVYGDIFKSPAKITSQALVPVNNIKKENWYGLAKLHAEIRHRLYSDLSIVDIRIFNYFSHTQNMTNGFFITSIATAIKNKEIFITNNVNITRDFVHPSDLFSLIFCIINNKPLNKTIDCYSKKPITKIAMLKYFKNKFDLNYKIVDDFETYNATGNKMKYFSTNKFAATLGYDPKYTSLKSLTTEILNYV